MKVLIILVLFFSFVACDITLDKLKSEEINELFLEYAKDGNYRVLNDLIVKGANVRATDKRGRNALHLAVLDNNHFVIRFLKNKGVPIDGKDNEGNTALHLAALSQRSNLFRLLYFLRADPSIKNNQCLTPPNLLPNNDRLFLPPPANPCGT